MKCRLLLISIFGLALAACLPFGGGHPGEEIRGYRSFDPARVPDSVTPNVVSITVADSCQDVRVIFLTDKGQQLGTMLDSVLCPGSYRYDLAAVRSVVDTAGRPETTWVRLDTLPFGMYFYKIFTPTSTKIENLPLLHKR